MQVNCCFLTKRFIYLVILFILFYSFYNFSQRTYQVHLLQDSEIKRYILRTNVSGISFFRARKRTRRYEKIKIKFMRLGKL